MLGIFGDPSHRGRVLKVGEAKLFFLVPLDLYRLTVTVQIDNELVSLATTLEELEACIKAAFLSILDTTDFCTFRYSAQHVNPSFVGKLESMLPFGKPSK